MGRGRSRKHIEINHNSEFELDLAPLLAVMVKLVPVLLVSSAFTQLMVIESQLPQVVEQAIHEQEIKPNPTHISLEISRTEGVKINLIEEGQSRTLASIPNVSSGSFDLALVHLKLKEVKAQHPEIFKLELSPSDEVAYKDLVKIMDEARMVKDNSTKFPVINKKTGLTETTNYMFPEIVFANMFEG